MRPTNRTRPRTPGSPPACVARAPSSSAKPTSTSSPMASPAKTATTVTACSLPTPVFSPAAPPVARLRPSRKAPPSPPSAPTPEAPCALPAALCGLAGYRASLGIGDWMGGYHLAQSFDTVGWLCRDLRDLPLLAESLFDLPLENPTPPTIRIGVLTGPLLETCETDVRHALADWQDRLHRASAQLEPFCPPFWSEAWDIYAPLQAHEAAQLHTGFFHEFDPTIAARLAWGASLSESELQEATPTSCRFPQPARTPFPSIRFPAGPGIADEPPARRS